MFVKVLLSKLIVLLVSACEPVRVATVASIAKVTVLVSAVDVRPVLPANTNVSLSKSMAISVVPSETSKSCAVTLVST